MWSFNPPKSAFYLSALFAVGLLQACTVEPLHGNSTTASLTGNSTASSILARTEIAPSDGRIGQQTRNALLFSFNGGKKIITDSPYKIHLSVTSVSRNLSVLSTVQSPTSAQVQVNATYSMIDKKSQKVVAKGKRKSIAAYDLTNQNFANQRAKRDAENRAAKDVAQQIRLALSQNVSKL